MRDSVSDYGGTSRQMEGFTVTALLQHEFTAGRCYCALAAMTSSATRLTTVGALFLAVHLQAQAPAPKTFTKHVLAWPDVRNGYQHDSISHALATIERLGRESGAYDTVIRTDSQLITKRPITFKTGTGIATGEQFLVRTLTYFDAIFFFGVREIDLTAEQRADSLSFVRDDGKGFVATHSASTRRSSRGRSSATCWAAGSTSIRGKSSRRRSSSRTRISGNEGDFQPAPW